MTRKQRAVVVACVSDLHAGSSVALCQPRVTLDDGGEYSASRAQLWLWQCWQDYWVRAEAVRREHNAELYIVFNGDMVDGQVKHSTQILSGNPNAQAAVVDACLKIPLALKPAKVFVIRGTEAHTGQSASAEERIASGLRKDKRPIQGDPDTGSASWWHCRMEIHGKLIDITHHGRTGQREHTRFGAAGLHAHDIFLSHAKRGERHPDLCLRAHYHRFNDSHDAAPTRVITTGAWQLKTGFVHRVAADTMADVGGLLVVFKEGKMLEPEKVQFTASRGAIWRA